MPDVRAAAPGLLGTSGAGYAPHGAIAVSYTHLDVYKRQAGSHAIERQLLKAVEEFTQGTVQNDDITFVMVEKYQCCLLYTSRCV